MVVCGNKFVEQYIRDTNNLFPGKLSYFKLNHLENRLIQAGQSVCRPECVSWGFDIDHVTYRRVSDILIAKFDPLLATLSTVTQFSTTLRN